MAKARNRPFRILDHLCRHRVLGRTGSRAIQFRVESGCGAVAVGRACLFPPLSSGGALVARPSPRFPLPLIGTDMGISLSPAPAPDLTPLPTARRALSTVDARSPRTPPADPRG